MEHVTLTVERLRQLAESREPIVASWLEEAVVLHGPALDTLIRPAVANGVRHR
jgi:hypothetical protein